MTRPMTIASEPRARSTDLVLERPGRNSFAARRLVRRTGRRAHLPAPVVEGALSVTDELVAGSAGRTRGPVRITIVARGSELEVRVADSLATPPAATAEPDWEVVRRVAASWGYRCDGTHRERWAVVRSAGEPTDI